MDAITATIVVHGLAAFLLILGGVCAIFFGYRLFKDGIGLEVDHGQLKLKFGGHELEFSSSTVGGVLMLTACVWGGFGFLALPDYAEKGVKVSSLDSAVKSLTFQPNQTALVRGDEKIIADFAALAKKSITNDPWTKVLVVSGSTNNNDGIEKRRSEKVINALMKFGVDKKHIEAGDSSTLVSSFHNITLPTSLSSNKSVMVLVRKPASLK